MSCSSSAVYSRNSIGQELSPAVPFRTQLIVMIKWNQFEFTGVDRRDRIWTSLRLFYSDNMWCLTAEENCCDLPCRRLLRDPATPRQIDSHLQCRAGCQTARSAQQPQWSGWLYRRIGAVEIDHRIRDELDIDLSWQVTRRFRVLQEWRGWKSGDMTAHPSKQAQPSYGGER